MACGPNIGRKSRKRARTQRPLFPSASGVDVDVDVASGHSANKQQDSTHEGDTMRVAGQKKHNNIPKPPRRLQHDLRDRYEIAQGGESQKLKDATADEGQMNTVENGETASSDGLTRDRDESNAPPIDDTTDSFTIETPNTSVSESADGTPAGETVEMVAAVEDDEQEVPASADDNKSEDQSSNTVLLDESDTITSPNSPTIGPDMGTLTSSLDIEADAANATSSEGGEDESSSGTSLDDESDVSGAISPASTQPATLASSSFLFPTAAPTIQVSSSFPLPAPTPTPTTSLGAPSPTDQDMTVPPADAVNVTALPTAESSFSPSTKLTVGEDGLDDGDGSAEQLPQMVSPQPGEIEPSGPELQPLGEDPRGDKQDEEETDSEPSPFPTPSLTEEDQDPFGRHDRDWKSLVLDADNDYTTVLLSPPKPEGSSNPSETYSSSPSFVPSRRSGPSTDEPTIESTITFEPTGEPTASEADLVAVVPPTVRISSQPTTTFSPTITFQPTITRQPTVTPAPTTLLDCLTVNGAYDYGKTSTVMDGVTAVPVIYRYEVEFQQQVDREVVQNDVVPKLELALNEQLLPSLFDSCQLEEGIIADGRRLQTRGSPIVGISAARDDGVLDSEACEATRDSIDSGPCTPVLGDLTIYVDENEPIPVIEEAKGAVLRLVEFAMDRNELNDADLTIRKVVFIPAPGTPSPTPQVDPERSGGSAERIRGFAAIITFAILFLLAGLFMIYYGIKKIKDDNDSVSKDESYGGNVEDGEEQIQTEIEDGSIFGALEYGRDDDAMKLDDDEASPIRASGAPSAGTRANRPGQGSNEIMGSFESADGTFEQDVSDDWGTPESSSSKF